MRQEQESLPENSGDSAFSNSARSNTETDFNQPADWHWIEIEGEATPLPLDELAASSTSTSLTPTSIAAQLPAERSDEVVIASLSQQQITVNAGGTASLQVTLLNNGNRTARFRLQVDSELNDEWIDPLDQSILLQPGEGSVLEINIHPPRTSAAQAGEYPLRISADAAEYHGRYTELQALVTINPFRELAVGTVQLQSPTVNVFRRSVRLAVPVSNLGNVTTIVQIGGYEQGRHYLYRFAANATDESQQPTISLEPGQSTFVHALVRPLQRAWVGAQPRQWRPALLFQIADEARAPRTAVFSLYDLPAFGIWTIAGLAAAALLMAIGIVAAGVIAAGIWWIRQMPAQAQPIVQQVSAPQPAQPVVVVIPMNSAPAVNSAVNPAASSQSTTNQPAAPIRTIPNPQANQETIALPSPTPESERNAATFNNQGAIALTAPLAPGNEQSGNVPIITAADITQPGAQASTLQSGDAQSAPAFTAPQPVISQPPVAKPEQRLTYAQMFQEIALRYDLNWRLLAAQAYIESGFDSLALGKDGDMGLMQILPKTWQEFAPQVNVKDPFESYSNTLVAAAYLDYLRAELGAKGYPQQAWMLVAYNWGPDHVLDFLASGGNWETLDPERRKYAEEILRISATIP